MEEEEEADVDIVKKKSMEGRIPRTLYSPDSSLLPPSRTSKIKVANNVKRISALQTNIQLARIHPNDWLLSLHTPHVQGVYISFFHSGTL